MNSTSWRHGVLGFALAFGLGSWNAAVAAPAPTLGAIVPKSWPSAEQGDDIVRGMQLAIKTWPGRPAPTLVVKDGACKAPQSEAAARELVAAKVDLVLGSWCVMGQVSKLVTDAGLPFVSAHAGRIANAPAQVSQLGRVDLHEAERIAAKLRAETGLRVSARTSCWMDFEPVMWSHYDALLCPSLGYDKSRWLQAEATYSAAYGKPFTQSAARGYAAMEVALAQLRRKSLGAKTTSEPISTILGPLLLNDAQASADTMQLVFSDRLPRLAAREQAAVNSLVQSKSCACAPTQDCAKTGLWSDMPFQVRGEAAECPVVSSAMKR